MTHCWSSKAANAEIGSDEWVDALENPGTCMLELGHDGPHEYTLDHEITVAFSARYAPEDNDDDGEVY